MLYYIPLEPYEQRYTAQLSEPETGWLEGRWRERGIEYVRIAPDTMEQTHIEMGQVLDGKRRWEWASYQITHLINLAQQGHITDDDVIFFDDFWTPGLAHLFYVFHQCNVFPRCYAFCYAQSVDEYDFTFPMRSWLRHFEKGIGACMSGVFVANSMLKDMLVWEDIVVENRCHVVGLPYDGESVRDRFFTLAKAKGCQGPPPSRKDRVVFSSRVDKEKDPEFFLDVAKRVWRTHPDVEFCMTTSAPAFKSNDATLIETIRRFNEKHDKFKLRTGLSKWEYYELLISSKIQFNCALQDWVSFTLLEATTFGCIPVYPQRRSFPETFTDASGTPHDEYMYEVDTPTHAPSITHDTEVANAAELILVGLQDGMWDRQAVEDRDWIWKRYDHTWERMLWHMNVIDAIPTERQGLYG